MKPLSPEELETLVGRALDSLPDQPAPVSLERSVMDAVQRRAAQPWWRCSWSHWPKPAQVVFTLGSAMLAASIIMGLSDWFGRTDLGFTTLLSNFERVQIGLTGVRDGFVAMVEIVPPLWRYAVLVVMAGAYALLAGLTAVTYRLIFQPR